MLPAAKPWPALEPKNTTTNNRMELNAVLQALLALRKLGSSVLIRSDSKYTIDSCATWMPGWKAKGWKRKGGELKNVDLLKQLDAALDRYDVRFEWVKGHAGDTGNEFVDQLLNQSMDQAASTSGGGAIEQRLSWPPN